MNIRLIAVTASLSLGLSLVNSCAPSAEDSDEGTHTGSVSKPVAAAPAHGALPDLSAIEATPFDLAHPERHGLGILDLEPYVDADKVRNGVDIGFNERVGNGIVGINNGNGPCTAQVLNRNFLLTAAHCVSPGWNALWATFTKRDKTRVSLFPGAGAAFATLQPGSRLGDKDTALLYLPIAIPTCTGNLESCATTRPDVPQHPLYQYFKPAFAPRTMPAYFITGYGSTDGGEAGLGILRSGIMSLSSAVFTDSNTGFAFQTIWGSDNQARACNGDSGGPLVFNSTPGGFLLYTGIASNDPFRCISAQGIDEYSGLSESQASWLLSTMAALSTANSLRLRCSIGTDTTGLSLFRCL